MGNNHPTQKPANEHSDKDIRKTHIDEHGKKEDDSAIYLNPEEGSTLQTPEEFAKDKGKIAGDEDKEITVDTEDD